MAGDDKTQVLDEGLPKDTRILNFYEIDHLIARGGMAEVYLGHNTTSGEPVAIKIVLPGLSQDETILKLFDKEARTLGRLSHEAIVQYHLYAIDQAIGRPCMVMEYVEGTSLEMRLADGPMPASDVRRMMLRIAKGLSRAHSSAVIHRDLSPDNVILPHDNVDEAKIVDFGIAKSANIAGADGGVTILEGKFAGKFNFVAPEQLGLAGAKVTEASDIYSLGLVMAAALRGAVIDMGGTHAEAVQCRASVPNLTGIDPAFLPLLTDMLAPQPEDRPANMAEIVGRLQKMTLAADGQGGGRAGQAAEGGTSASPFGDFDPVVPAGKTGASVPHTRGQDTNSKNGGYGMVLAGVLVAGLAGGIAYFAGLFDPKDPGPGPDKATVEPELPKMASTTPPTDKAPPTGVATGDTDPQPAAPPDLSAQMIAMGRQMAFVSGFDGGPCFFTVPTRIDQTMAEIEAFGLALGPFRAIHDQFQDKFGIEPNVGARVVAQNQCPVLDFMTAARDKGPSRVKLSLARDLLQSGEVISGRIEGIGGQELHLLLVDNTGGVTLLDDSITKIDSDRARFATRLQIKGQNRVPYLIVAVTSSEPLIAVSMIKGSAKSTEFRALLQEAETFNLTLSAAVKLLKIGG